MEFSIIGESTASSSPEITSSRLGVLRERILPWAKYDTMPSANSTTQGHSNLRFEWSSQVIYFMIGSSCPSRSLLAPQKLTRPFSLFSLDYGTISDGRRLHITSSPRLKIRLFGLRTRHVNISLMKMRPS